MKHDPVALRSLLLAVGLFALALLATWGAVSAGIDGMLVPTPKTTAEEFLRAMKAQRYEAAHELLAAQLGEEVSENEIQKLGASLDARHGGIEKANGSAEEQQAEDATATAVIRFDGGTEQTVTLPLVQEEGIWRIASIQPLLNLAS